VVTCLVYELFPGWWPSTGQNIRVTSCTKRGRRNEILWGREVVFHYHCQFVNNSKLDTCGYVHHSIIHIENPTRCNSVSKFYFIFIWSSTGFGRHTAHHQEPKTALAASGFACMGGCWTCSCWTPFLFFISYKYEIKFWYTVASCWIFCMNSELHCHTKFSDTHLAYS